MMACPTSKLFYPENATASQRRTGLSTPATATRRMRMPTLALALFLLLSSAFTWPQMVSSAPTPQQNDAVATAGQKDDGSLIDVEKRLRDDGNKSTPLEPPDIRGRSQRQNPIDNVNLMFSSFQDDSYISTTSPLERTMTPRSVDDQEDQPNLVFNMVIQKERTEKSAFIAPDVNWLRDLVPKVVDAVEQPETTIKEIIFNAMDEENDIQAEPIRDRQLFINVVKSQIGSENDVPEILASLRNLMQTGGPAVESKLLESRDIGEPQTRIYVINIIIFNVVVLEAPVEQPVFITDKVSHIEADITEDSYIVALKESQKNRFGISSSFGRNKSPAEENQQLIPRTPDTGFEEDSYLVALRESQKNRIKGPSSPVMDHHHHHEEKHHHHVAKPHHHHVVDEDATNQQQFNGHFLTEVPTYGYVSTARPLMAMEKDYLRRYTVKPVQQQSVDVVEEEEQSADEHEQSSDGQEQLAIEQQQLSSQSPVVDPYGSLEFVNLPTGPYFTNFGAPAQILNTETTTSIEKPPEIEAVVVDVAETGGVENINKVQTTKKPVVKKPLIVRVPEAVGVMTNKATNVVRNRIRTVGMFGIPMMVGLASTVNSWLPAVTAFGRRRRRRSITDEEENWEDNNNNNNHEMSSDDDRSRAIENAQMLARLMGKRAESLFDNWRNREQQETTSNIEVPTQSTSVERNKSAKKKRPLWFQRLSNVKRSRTSRKMKDILSSSRKYMTPLFYATFFGNEKEDVDNQNAAGDVMEHREEILNDSETKEAVADYDLEQLEVLENDAETVEPPIDMAVDSPPNSGDDEKPEEKEIEIVEEETRPEEDISDSPSINSYSGSDFDIVSNFVRAMMMNNDEENKDVDDSVENREEIFWVKEASIVNTTETVSSKPIKPPIGSSLLLLKPGSAGVRLPSTGVNGNTVSVFSADPIKPNWINSENVTNSPVTYVSIKSPTKVTWLGVGPPDVITSTQSSSAENDDPVEVIDNSDLPPSEIVGAPLEFYNEETDNYVSKEVPSVPVQPTVPYYSDQPPSTDEPPPQPLPDPGDMHKPLRPMVFRPTDLRPGLSSLLLTIASFNRPRLPPPIDVSSSVSTQGQANITPPDEEFRDDTTVKYTQGDGTGTQNDETLKYTHGHGIIVTNPPLHDFNQLTDESSIVSDSSQNQNAPPNLIKVTTNGQYDDELQSPSLMGDTSIQFVGMYGGTTVNSTYGEFSTTGIADSAEMESTLDDLITQLQTNLTTGLVTDRPVGGLHFVNSSTEIVIMNPFVTDSSIFPQLQVEAVEAEEGDTFGAIESVDGIAGDSIVVDAVEGNQPDSVPVVSNLANLFFGSSGGGSSSGSLITNGAVSAGGVSGGSVSSSTANPLALLYTFGLAAAGIFALTLPIWVPFVVAKKRRRTYAPSKTYPASKKKTPYSAPPKKTYGEPPPNHYKDLSEEEIYGNDHYLDQHQLASGPAQPQYQTTTVDDLFRPSVEIRNSDYSASNLDDHYIFRDSIALNPQDDMFNNPGPLDSEDVYGPPARIFLKARRRRSSRFQPSNKR